jgi:phosphomannomutase/phosphoglucomutase
VSIFRAYDIRGIYPEELNEDIARKTGAAFGTFISNRSEGSVRIAVGSDVRKSSPAIKKAFLEGLVSTGTDVVDIGIVTTPQLYFAVAKYSFSGGAIITASHNPKEYNGFKLTGKMGKSLSDKTGIKEIEEMTKTGNFKEGSGSVKEMDTDDDYVEHLKNSVRLQKPLKIVIDAGNGVGGKIGCRVFRELGCDVTELYCEPDEEFPNHPPDPIKKQNLADLQAKVKGVGADLGIAYDGDADRFVAVDSKGDIIETNTILAVFAEKAIKENPGAHIADEILCSRIVEDVVKMNGGKLFTSRVGHSFVQKNMMDNNCLVAGETSGHFMFKENWGFDDAIYASLKFAEIAAQESVDDLVKDYPKYYTSDDTRVPCPDDRKFEVVNGIKEKMREEGRRIVDIDGVKIFFDGYGWAIMRPSNTNPEIVLRWEATTEDKYREIENFVRSRINEALQR